MGGVITVFRLKITMYDAMMEEVARSVTSAPVNPGATLIFGGNLRYTTPWNYTPFYFVIIELETGGMQLDEDFTGFSSD